MRLDEWVIILGFLELNEDVLELDHRSPLLSWVTGKISYYIDSANFYTAGRSAKGGAYMFNISGMRDDRNAYTIITSFIVQLVFLKEVIQTSKVHACANSYTSQNDLI